MKLNPSDKISTTVTKVLEKSAYGSSEGWKNVSDIVITEGDAGRTIIPGRNIIVEIDCVDGETAYATILRAPYSRHLWPGDSIEVVPTQLTTNGFAVAKYNGGTVSQVHIVDALPEEMVDVRILKISGDIAIGKVVNRTTSEHKLEAKVTQDSSVAKVVGAGYNVELPQVALATGEVSVVVEVGESTTWPAASIVSYGKLLPEIGDSVTATSKKGKSQADPVNGSYSITLDQRVKASVQVEVEITRIDDQIKGTIIDIGALPRSGNEVEGQVERGSTHAVVSGPEYSVKLLQPSLITGTVDIRIESPPDESDSSGQIISYRGQLPEIGQTVQAISRADEKVADAKEGTYRIVLDETTSIATEIRTEIIRVDNQVGGRVVDPGALPRPGNKIEGQVTRDSTRAVATKPGYSIELSQPSLVTGKVTVEIDSSQGKDTTGRITSYRGQIPEVWETIQAVTRAGKDVANPDDGTYVVTVNESTPVATEVKVWITEVGEQVEGKIVDYGNLPLVGRTINANVILDKSVARVDDSYRIKLNSRSLASGTAAIKILSTPNSIHAGDVTGKIVSYGDSLPNPSETVRAKIDGKNSVAKPITGRYKIQLSNVGGRYGTGVVKITSVDEYVQGKILKMDSKKRSSSQRNPFSSSKNSLISNKKL